jgi:hypothetical protein
MVGRGPRQGSGELSEGIREDSEEVPSLGLERKVEVSQTDKRER